MTPKAITLLLREAREAFPPLKGKPSDGNLTTIRETLLPFLMEILYNQPGGVHSLTAILTDLVRYGWQYICLPEPPTALRQKYCKQCIDRCLSPRGSSPPHPPQRFASYKAGERGSAKFSLATVVETW